VFLGKSRLSATFSTLDRLLAQRVTSVTVVAQVGAFTPGNSSM